MHVGLYACDTARGADAEGSFADQLRDALRDDGHADAVVLGHSSAQDTVLNNDVRLFGGRDNTVTEGQFREIFPESVVAEAKGVVEASLGRPITSMTGFRRTLIYFYNAEFLWGGTAADLQDRARLLAAARDWVLAFAADPAWRRPLELQLVNQRAMAGAPTRH